MRVIVLHSLPLLPVSVIANIDLIRSLVVVGISSLLQLFLGSATETLVLAALSPMTTTVAEI